MRSISYGASHTRSSYYGLLTLTEEAFQNEFGIDASLWTTLVSRLCRTSSAVHAAISCLGAAYETLCCDKPSSSSKQASSSLVKQLYATSLRSLQDEIELCPDGPLPLFFASIILAGVEVLSSNPTNALMHVQGAYKVYAHCLPSGGSQWPKPPQNHTMPAEEQNALASIVQALDVQIASYALARPPDLPPSSAAGISDGRDPAMLSTQSLRMEILPLLHNCYHFAIHASKYKYVHYSHLPPDITVDHGRHIALLSSWMKVLRESEKRGPTIEQKFSARQRCILSLRAQCISTFIYLATILCAYETSYDAFSGLFEEIVQIAFLLLHRDGGVVKCKLGPRFRFLSSLSQPLFFTATKCRDPVIRRRAVELLAMTGKEGPWDARVLVRVAARAIELEESSESRIGQENEADSWENHDSPIRNLSTFVPGRSRMHGCGMEVVPVEKARQDQKGTRSVISVRFNRCVDVEQMVRSTKGDDLMACQDPRHWDILHEDIEL